MAATDVLHLRSLCTGAGFKTREVKVWSPARKSRTWDTDRPVAHHAMPPPMPYSSSEESPTSAVPDVGRRQVGRVADGAPSSAVSVATACAVASASGYAAIASREAT